MRFAGASDVGMVRKVNEDSYLANGQVFAVADGLGGHLAGEVASREAVDVIASLIEQEPSADPQSLIKRAIKLANDSIYELSKRDEKMQGMGTTITVLYPRGDGKATIGHVGDSRLYLVRDSKIRQLTKDQSLVQELVDSGKITKDQARGHPQKNVLSQALGTELEIIPQVFDVDVKENDLFILTTDGLTNFLEDPEIMEYLDIVQPLDQVARELISRANERGGTDNITVVLVHIDPK